MPPLQGIAPDHPPRNGFTLVELLVVIAVISVLMSLLMPALRAVRDLSRKVVCTSNLRQMGIALNLYVRDTRHYPGHLDWADGLGQVALWPTRIRTYMEDHDAFWCPSSMEGFRWQEEYGTGVWYASEMQTGWGYRIGERLLGVWGPFSYAYNDWGRWDCALDPERGLGGDNYWLGGEELLFSKVKNPRDMIAIGDNIVTDRYNFNMDPTNPWEYPGKRHNDGGNMLFCDAHVEWAKQADWINVDTATEAGRAMSARWNNHNEWWNTPP